MWVKKTKRRAIVKKKNVKAQSKIEEEAPEVGMVGVGAGNGWVTFRSDDGWSSTLPSSTDLILDKVRRFHQMDTGFLTTPIWDPRERRSDLYSYRSGNYGGLGFFDYQDVWGNDKEGFDWVD